MSDETDRASRVVELPTGTVTFLLTDIESSTRLWQNDPAAMKLAIDADTRARQCMISCILLRI